MKVKREFAEQPKKVSGSNYPISLPKEKSKPEDDFFGYVTLLHGEKRIGKTTLFANAPDAIFFMFEPNYKHIKAFIVPKPEEPALTWLRFKNYIREIKSTDRFKTIIIDPLDLAYRACFTYKCKQLGIEHPHDEEDWGKSWGQIIEEFSATMVELCSLNRGVIFIDHSEVREFTTRTGHKFQRLVPGLTGQCFKWAENKIANVIYYGYRGKERELVVRGDEFIWAGCADEPDNPHFRTPKGGKVISISAGSSAKEAYDNLMLAWNNKYEEKGGDLKSIARPKSRLNKVR